MNILSDNITRKMPSGLLTVDREGVITGFNPASERIFGGTLQLKLPLPELVRETQQLRDLLERCLGGEVFTRVEFHVRSTPDMEDKRIGINVSPFSNENGQI